MKVCENPSIIDIHGGLDPNEMLRTSPQGRIVPQVRLGVFSEIRLRDRSEGGGRKRRNRPSSGSRNLVKIRRPAEF